MASPHSTWNRDSLSECAGWSSRTNHRYCRLPINAVVVSCALDQCEIANALIHADLGTTGRLIGEWVVAWVLP